MEEEELVLGRDEKRGREGRDVMMLGEPRGLARVSGRSVIGGCPAAGKARRECLGRVCHVFMGDIQKTLES